jgi:receptor protein-tyrosine kinase
MSSQNQLAFRKRWWILPIAIAVALAGALFATKVAQPQYKATCKLFVALAANTTPSESWAGSQLTQDRVIAYLGLIKGDRVAHAAIDSLHLDMSAQDLVNRIEATAEPKSVLITVSITDSQSQRSAQLANAVCSRFQNIAADTEDPNKQVNVKLVERASAPQHPISPNGKRNLAVGGFIGLLLGTGLVLALARIRPDEAPVPQQEPDPQVFSPNGDVAATAATDGSARLSGNHQHH